MKKLYYLIAMALMGLTFTSCEDVPAPFGQPQNPNQQETIDPTGTGTAADPYNVAGILKYVKDLGADVESTTDVYFTGIVTSVTEAFGTQYGNATFTVADTETSKTIFTFYRGLYLGNKKYDDPNATNVKEGDKVVICGKVVYYKGSTPETAQGKAYVVSINGTGGGGGGDTPAPTGEYGTKENPLTVAKALEVINGLADNGTVKPAYVKGKISNVQKYDADHKSITYYISDDGTDNNALQVYSGKGIDGADFAAATDLEKGWTVIVTGELKKYVNSKTSAVTLEINQSSQIVSIDKTTGGGGDTPSGEAKGDGTEGNPFNVAAAVAKCKEVGTTASTDKYYIKGITTAEYTVESYKNVTVDIVDTEGATEKFKVYRVKDKDGKGIKEGYKIPKGATIIVYGPVVNYQGNTPETSNGAYLVSVNGNAPEVDGGDTGGGDTGGGDTGGNTISADMSSFNIGNGIEMGTVTLTDGTKLIFEAGENSNAPKYYTTGSAARMYPKNTLTVTASKKISEIKLTCSANNAEGQITATNGTVAVAEMIVTISAINNTTTTITNAHTGTGATSQLRIGSITITYAE